MLTKDDLQSIQQLVRTEIRAEVDPLKKSVGGLQQDVGQLQQDIGGIKEDITSIKQQVKPIKSMQRNIKILLKDVKYMSGKFDEEIVYTRRRVEKIEKHLHLESPKN